MCGMNERCVQYEKDKRHWGPAVRFEVRLTWGCARKEHFIRNTGTLNARLRRWPKVSHSGPLASSVSIRAQTVPPSIHTHTLPPSLFSCFLVVRWFFYLQVHLQSVMQTTAANNDMTDWKDSFSRFLYYTSEIWSLKDKNIYYRTTKQKFCLAGLFNYLKNPLACEVKMAIFCLFLHSIKVYVYKF